MGAVAPKQQTTTIFLLSLFSMFHHYLVLVRIFFLRTLLSYISRRFCSVTILAHVSQLYVTIGCIIDLYICSLLAALRSLFFRSFLFRNRLLFPAYILNLIPSFIKFLLFICDPKYTNCIDNAMYTNSRGVRFESELLQWSFPSSWQKPDYCPRLASAILQKSCHFVTRRSS